MEQTTRKDIAPEHTWDLSMLFADRTAWEQAYTSLEKEIPQCASFEGTISQDANHILKAFTTFSEILRKLENLYAYAMLRYCEDSTDTEHQELIGKAQILSTQYSQATAFFSQELVSLPKEFLGTLQQSPRFEDYTQQIREIIREKAHILSNAEEKLLARQQQYNNGFSNSFNSLIDADMQFGTVDTPEGEVIITHASMEVLREHQDRTVRKEASQKYYKVFNDHLQVLSQLYTAQVQQDVAIAEIRNYDNSLHAALYGQDIPETLYKNLLSETRRSLPELHRYYAFLKEQTQLDDYASYDFDLRVFPAPEHDMPYEEAVALLCKALAPLGKEYINVLQKGLLQDRWVDRYENKGKRSGAFSMGGYDAYPYIMLNYQSKSLYHVFILAHEAGHSMHTYFANQANTYPKHHYTIFEAEVASTVNEFLLYRYLIEHADAATKPYLLWRELKAFTGTFYRQCLFAEFELQAHQHVEQGKALTAHFFTELAKQLCHDYYGDAVHIPEEHHILGLRIPHFYRNYYVFKYATGIAAAIDIGSRIYQKKDRAVSQYFDFLRSGGSRFPIESLQLAGVDYTTTAPITVALGEFSKNRMHLEHITKQKTA